MFIVKIGSHKHYVLVWGPAPLLQAKGRRGGRQRLTFLANNKSSMIFTTFHSRSHTQTNASGYVVKLQGGGADTMDHCIFFFIFLFFIRIYVIKK